MEYTKNEIKLEDKRNELVQRVIAWFADHKEVFTEVIEELDCFMGYLGDDRRIDMSDFDLYIKNTSAYDLACKIFAGADEYDGQFNPNRQYFYFDGYANLVSTDDKDYTFCLDEDFVDTLIDYYQRMWSIEENTELKEMLDQIEDIDAQKLIKT